MSKLEDLRRKDKKNMCPNIATEEQIGTTEEEKQWVLKKEQRPPLPKSLFIILSTLVIFLFVVGGILYYRSTVLPEKHYQAGTILFKQQEYNYAVEHFLKVLKLRPERKDVLYQIAFCFEMMNKTKDAIQYYEKHLEILPNDTRATIRLGWLYLENGDKEKALSVLENATKKDRKNADLWNLTSKIKITSGDRNGAIEALSNFAKYTNDTEALLSTGKKLINLRAYEKAVEAYERYSKKVSSDKRGEHGALAAKIMMGHPGNSKLVIMPGKSMGYISLDDTKDRVKKNLGEPNKKFFSKFQEKSNFKKTDVETWVYNKKDFRHRAVSIVFVNGRVVEVETASDKYKTEKGLGISNFLLTKNSSNVMKSGEIKNGMVTYIIDGGGLTFYARKNDKSGIGTKHRKLRLHKGKRSQFNEIDFNKVGSIK